MNIWQSYKQERDRLVRFLRLLAVCWPGAQSFTELWPCVRDPAVLAHPVYNGIDGSPLLSLYIGCNFFLFIRTFFDSNKAHIQVDAKRAVSDSFISICSW